MKQDHTRRKQLGVEGEHCGKMAAPPIPRPSYQTYRMEHAQHGSVLLFSLVMAVAIGGILAAAISMAFTFHRASTEALDSELAYRAAESGAAYYLTELVEDPNYLRDFDPANFSSVAVGDATFQLLDAVQVTTEQWEISVHGQHDTADFYLDTVIGYTTIEMPTGLVVGGTGDPADTVLTLTGKANLYSYDPAAGSPGGSNINETSDVFVNGSVEVVGGSTSSGDITATGTVTTTGTATVTGTAYESADETALIDMDSAVNERLSMTRAANDNSTLASLFGSDWSPISGAENYGDLYISGGTYEIPSGNYRIRNLVIEGGATITFDTSHGSTSLVIVGDGTSTGGAAIKNSDIYIDNGGTNNSLVTVLGTNATLAFAAHATFGQEVNNAYTSLYSKIIAPSDAGSYNNITANNSLVYSAIHAPAHDFQIAGGTEWYGAAAVKSATINATNSVFGIDESLAGSTVGDPSDFDVHAQWQGQP